MAANFLSRRTVFGVVVGLCLALVLIRNMLSKAINEIPAIRVAPQKVEVQRKQLPAGGNMIENFILKTWDINVFKNFDSSHTTRKNVFASGPSSMGITSHAKTIVQLISPRGHIQVGDIIKYRIQARDSEGRDRIIGGDFWYATLNSTNPLASTAGYVIDYNNGTYEVTLLAAWAGQAEFRLILVHPSEAVNHLRNVVRNSEHRSFWTGYFNKNGKKSESSACFLRSGGPWTEMCEYPAHQALGKTIFLCQKPKRFSCNDFNSYKTDWDKCNARADELTEGKEYLFKSPYFMQPVQIKKDGTLKIEAGFLPPLEDLPRCLPDQEIPAVQGYWLNGTWHSMLCRMPDFPMDVLRKCLHGKTLLLHGDSTTRQWFEEFHKVLPAGERIEKTTNKPGELKPTQSLIVSTNLTIYFYFHPDRYGYVTYASKGMEYEVDVLDKLTTLDCRRYIIVLSPWAHFTLWTRDGFIERMALVRNAVLRLRKRCPDIIIVIKGPHPRHFANYFIRVNFSDFLAKENGYILRDAFEGTGAFYLPVWDLNLSHHSRNQLHMPKEVIAQELKMFLGYICDNLTY
ncbi:NXPE family member 4-like [Asterias amurensis]|uniref:NXPE family member 4-like n=1 Tax=Asterias amurensis TaxID=7602 RepID=UPI003AB3F486